jgi:Cu2+-containing amine oxidase
VKISDADLVNAQGKRSTYVLIPERSGMARHVEAHSKHDFWVTREQVKGIQLNARELPVYVSNQQSVVGTDIVVWYTGSFHHEERDEDDEGPTHIMWVGFTLKPHDLFDASPLYP